MKKVLSVAMLVLLCLLAGCGKTPTPQTSVVSTAEINSFLTNAGFPQEVMSTISFSQKQVIYKTALDKTVRFYGLSEMGFVLESSGMFAPAETGDTPDLTLSVLTVTIQTEDGKTAYGVYPAFRWHTEKLVTNDEFEMEMYSGWAAVPGERNFRLCYQPKDSIVVNAVERDPYNAGQLGYTYKMESKLAGADAQYAGYAYYMVEKTVDTAMEVIILRYAHKDNQATAPLYLKAN